VQNILHPKYVKMCMWMLFTPWPVFQQKSVKYRLRQWDFRTPESCSCGRRSKCADLCEPEISGRFRSLGQHRGKQEGSGRMDGRCWYVPGLNCCQKNIELCVADNLFQKYIIPICK